VLTYDQYLDSSWRRGVYRAIVLTPIRRVSSLVRKILGPGVPPWLEDTSDLLGLLNLAAILPTLLAILITPQHFFRRLRSDGGSTIAFGMTPVKLTLQTAIIVALLASLLKSLDHPAAHDVDDKIVFGGLIFFVAYYLVVIPLSVALNAVIARAVRLLSWPPLKVPAIVPSAVSYVLFLDVSLVCFRNFFFRRVVFAKFLWGTCYWAMVQVLSAVVSVVALVPIMFGDMYLITRPLIGLGWKIIALTATFIVFLAVVSTLPRLQMEALAAMLESACTFHNARYYRRRTATLCKNYKAALRCSKSPKIMQRLRAESQQIVASTLEDIRTTQSRLRGQINEERLYNQAVVAGLASIPDLSRFFDSLPGAALADELEAMRKVATLTVTG